MNSERRKAYLALLITAFLWGLSPPIIKYTLGFTTPFTFLFYRFLIASLILTLPLILRIRKIKPSLKDIGKYLILGFLATPLNLGLLFWGIQKTSAIDASLISIISPMLVILGGVFFLREKVTGNEKLGIGLILLGTMITIIQPLFAGGADEGKNLLGNGLVFLGALDWAAFVLLTKKQKLLDPFILSSSSFLIGLVSFLPIVTFNFELLTFNLNAIYGVLYMALFGSVIAYFTYVYGLSKIEASETEVFTYLQPIFAVPVSVLFLGEKLSLPFLAGLLFMGIGVIACQWRPRLFTALRG